LTAAEIRDGAEMQAAPALPHIREIGSKDQNLLCNQNSPLTQME
jgi:hypothetical protein